MGTFLVIFEAKSTKAARNPKEAARRIHQVQAKDKDEAVQTARQADMRHSMRLLDEANVLEVKDKAAAKFARQRADVDDWKLVSAEAVS